MIIRTALLTLAAAGALCITLVGAGMAQAAPAGGTIVGSGSGSTMAEAKGSPIAVPGQPASVVTSPNGSRVYVGGVTGSRSSGISVIDAASNTVLANIAIPAPYLVQSLVLSPDGTRLYATANSGISGGPSELFTVDTSTNSLVDTANYGFTDGHVTAIAVSPNGQRIWGTMDDAQGTIFSMNPATGAILSTAEASTPLGIAMALNPSGTKLYAGQLQGGFGVLDVATNTYSVLYDPATSANSGSVVANTGTLVNDGYHAAQVSPDGTNVLFTTYSGWLVTYSTATGTTKFIAVTDVTAGRGGNPYGLAVSPGWTYAYVALDEFDQVVIVDLASGLVVNTIDVGRFPLNLGISPNGNSLYVTNHDSSTVTVLDLRRLTITVPAKISIGATGITGTVALSGGGALPAAHGTNGATVEIYNSDGALVASAAGVALGGAGDATVPLYPTLGGGSVQSAGTSLSASTAGLTPGIYSVHATMTVGADRLVAIARGVVVAGDDSAALAATGVDARPYLVIGGALVWGGFFALSFMVLKRSRRRRAHRG